MCNVCVTWQFCGNCVCVIVLVQQGVVSEQRPNKKARPKPGLDKRATWLRGLSVFQSLQPGLEFADRLLLFVDRLLLFEDVERQLFDLFEQGVTKFLHVDPIFVEFLPTGNVGQVRVCDDVRL